MASSPPQPPPRHSSSPTPPPSYITHLPIAPSSPSRPSEKVPGEEEPRVPIHVVTKASQLPIDFLLPSPRAKFVIGFDCEAVDLCRYGKLCIIQSKIVIDFDCEAVDLCHYGKLCIIQLAFPDAIYLVDAIVGGDVLIRACKPALESDYITKVIHDCKRDSEALYFQFGIKLNNVVDTQIAYSLIEEQEGQKRLPDDYISLVALLADQRYCGLSYVDKEEVRVLLRQDPKFWTYRPLTEQMIHSAADDVRFLLYIYHQMMAKLTERSLWHLAVRGALYCRCFCVNSNDYADWPSLPPIPDTLKVDENGPEEEILSVLDVPKGRMGCIIGKKGASIMAIKESCNAEIVIGGARGPPDKVFILGPEKQVKKAEAMLRGRLLYI